MWLSRHGLRRLLAFVVFIATLAPSEAAASVNAPVLLRILTPRTGEVVHSNQDTEKSGLVCGDTHLSPWIMYIVENTLCKPFSSRKMVVS
jgi:hypothetical protein